MFLQYVNNLVPGGNLECPIGWILGGKYLEKIHKKSTKVALFTDFLWPNQILYSTESHEWEEKKGSGDFRWHTSSTDPVTGLVKFGTNSLLLLFLIHRILPVKTPTSKTLPTRHFFSRFSSSSSPFRCVFLLWPPRLPGQRLRLVCTS